MAKGSSAPGSSTGRRTSETPAARPTKAGSSGRAQQRPGAKSRRPPPVVVRKSRPWGLIAGAIAVVLFAVASIGYAVYKVDEKNALSDPSTIQGLQTRSFPAGGHTNDPVAYDESPPIGGEHDPVWADCTGTVYPLQIRNENAVHSLEHGAVWVTYNPDLPDDQLQTLFDLVDGQPFMLMSPYPGLKTPISLQAWGNQLFLESAGDPRIQQFITALRQSPANTPELGASCDNPDFAQNPRQEEPASPIDPSGAPATTAP